MSRILTPVIGRALLFCGFVLPATLFAQVPLALEFQGIARDAGGDPLPSQSIQLRLGIISGSPVGPLVYQETQSTVTSPLGLFGVQVGNGNLVLGTFADVAWGTASHFLNVELDPSGGSNYQLIGTTHLLSVPYALVAGSTPCYTVSMMGDTLHEGPDCYVIVPGLSAANGGCSDADGDTYFSLAGCGTPVDCNDGNAAVHPGASEVCDGIDNNCSGPVDEGFDLLNDPNNCGTCGHACSFPHATSLCVNRVCEMGICDGGWGDCDGNPVNGCETDLSISFSDCGTCGHSCDDGMACTDDVCQAGVCAHPVQPNTCVIAGVCYANGALRPGFPCQLCDPNLSTGSWSNVSAGTDPGNGCAGDCNGAGACGP